jgi:ATP-dependent Clp protease, protease subunit
MNKKLNSISSLYDLPRYTECYTNLANNRIIFISEVITKDVAASMSALLLYYDQESEVDDINVYINTNGGDVSALLSIYDTMHIISAPVKTICIGKAYSAGADILAAGTKGKRYATRHSMGMIHSIQCETQANDQVKSKIVLDFIKENNLLLMNILAKNTGKSLKEILEDCKQDKYMDAKEMRAYGLVDHII